MTQHVIKIGLAGNPNVGKTTIFNALTGKNQKVGNYPGVTVEKKEGVIKYGNYQLKIFDLPGIYSLTAYSTDEVVARNFLLDDKPDIIVDVVDATNIERNLFLCLQLRELDIPVLCAMNILDQAESMGIKINTVELSRLLDLPIVNTVGSAKKGIDNLLKEIVNLYESKAISDRKIYYGEAIEKEIANIEAIINQDGDFNRNYSPRWLAVKLLEKDTNANTKIALHQYFSELESTTQASIKTIEKKFQTDSEIVLSEQRYSYIHGAVTETVSRETQNKIQISEKIDKILMNKYLGLPIFLFILWAIFQLTFTLGEYPMGWLETGFGMLGSFATKTIPEGPLQSMVVDGIIGGVGGVLSFVPLIIILFILLSFLEDTGYIARTAFLVDKFLHIFKLHGQSFLPMILGFGCSVPAIMSSRTLRNSKDRIVTTMIIPFMSCGAKLPVYVLLAGAFFPKHAGNVVLSIYILGVVLALLTALLIKKLILKGESSPFVMELPPYRMPGLTSIARNTWQKTRQYLKKAGTMLLAASILIWAAVSYPKPSQKEAEYDKITTDYANNPVRVDSMTSSIAAYVSGDLSVDKIENATDRETLAKSLAEIKSGKTTIEKVAVERLSSLSKSYTEHIKSEDALEYSIAGRLGKVLEPLVKPIGFDWKIATSVVTGFAAKEAVVSTLGVLYKVGEDESESSNMGLREALRKDSTFNPLVGYILMIFTLIIAPCIAALSAIRAEVGWRWLAFGIGYTFLLAWSLGFIVFQIGSFFKLGI